MIEPCPERPSCIPCPHPTITRNMSGPDEPGISCYVPEGCCPDLCALTEDDYICQVRTLLPQGEGPYNATQIAYRVPPQNMGATTIGCARIGCEQLIIGGCCDDENLCDDDPIAVQLAVVDSWAAAAYKVIRALCDALRELDPCTSEKKIREWAKRLGIISDDPCGPQWSDETLKVLVCVLPMIKKRPFNMELLTELAGVFGATVTVRAAGAFNDGCAPGWWSMARDRDPNCAEPVACPPDARHYGEPLIQFVPECEQIPDSLNIVLCPSERKLPENCNLPIPTTTLPHDPELFQALWHYLPKLLPPPTFWCLYNCDPADCVQ